MPEKKQRRVQIVDVAMRLARGKGFDRMGLREVAEEAGVALGTLYKSFRSKEEIVTAAVGQQTWNLRKRFEQQAMDGATAEQRLEELFSQITRALCRRPAYAKAVLTAVTTGVPDLVAAVVQHEDQMTRIIIGALRGVKPKDLDPSTCTDAETTFALLLRQIWFSALIGWSCKYHPAEEVVRQSVIGARWLLRALPSSQLERNAANDAPPDPADDALLADAAGGNG